MPELPEVETARRQLERWMVGETVAAAYVPRSRLLGGTGPKTVEKSLVGHRVEAILRKGKHLLVVLDGEQGLYLHLGMTGKFAQREGDAEPVKSTRLVLHFDGRQVQFLDARMFGRIDAGPLEEMKAKWLDRLGPDPLLEKVDGKTLAARVGRTARPIKVALMDQALIAGLGNIHVVEALWLAKIGPYRAPKTLTPKEWSALAKGIQGTISFALKRLNAEEVKYLSEGAVNPFRVYDRKGAPCRRCGAPIAMAVLAGRSTYWCPDCQDTSAKRPGTKSAPARRAAKTPAGRRRPSPSPKPR